MPSFRRLHSGNEGIGNKDRIPDSMQIGEVAERKAQGFMMLLTPKRMPSMRNAKDFAMVKVLLLCTTWTMHGIHKPLPHTHKMVLHKNK